MRKVFVTLCLMLMVASSAMAQTKTWKVVESGWGRIDWGWKQLNPGGAASDMAIDEMNIHRWKKTPGTLTVDFGKNTAELELSRKKSKSFNLLTESQTFKSRDGWTYVEHLAADTSNASCRFWLCENPDGFQRLLVIYPRARAVYGYMLVPSE